MTLTAEQLEIRRRGLGSSDIAAVAGLNPWRKPIDVYLEKTGRAEASVPTMRTRVGHALEERIAELYAEDLGYVLHETMLPGTTVVSEAEPWLVATPDFIAHDIDRAPRIVEVKVVGARLAHHWSDGLPDYVLAQILHQQRVTGIRLGTCAALIGGTDFQTFDCPYLLEVADDLAEIGRVFWYEHVLKDIPPPIDGSESWRAYAARRWPSDSKPMLAATEEAEALAKRLAEARARETFAADERAVCETELKALIGDHAGIRGSSWQVTWKGRAGSTSWKQIAEELGATPDLIEKHRGAPTRVFAFKTEG